MPIMWRMALQCVTAPQAPFTCAVLQYQAKCWWLSSISTSRTGREMASGTSPFSSTPIGSSPHKTGDHDDPCWGMAGNHSYVADVTRFVPIGGNLNQDYEVVLQFDVETSTTGQNPWSPIEPNQQIRVEGATLVAVYRNQDTAGPVFVYDAINNSTDIHRMLGSVSEVCCRTMAFARPRTRQERHHAPTDANSGSAPVRSSEIALIKTHLSHVSCWN